MSESNEKQTVPVHGEPTGGTFSTRRTFLQLTAAAAVLGLDVRRLVFPDGPECETGRGDDCSQKWIGQPIGGTFTVSFEGRTSAPLPCTCDQAHLDRALAEIGAGDLIGQVAINP